MFGGLLGGSVVESQPTAWKCAWTKTGARRAKSHQHRHLDAAWVYYAHLLPDRQDPLKNLEQINIPQPVLISETPPI